MIFHFFNKIFLSNYCFCDNLAPNFPVDVDHCQCKCDDYADSTYCDCVKTMVVYELSIQKSYKNCKETDKEKGLILFYHLIFTFTLG